MDWIGSGSKIGSDPDIELDRIGIMDIELTRKIISSNVKPDQQRETCQLVVNFIQLIVKQVKGLKAVWQTAGNKNMSIEQ